MSDRFAKLTLDMTDRPEQIPNLGGGRVNLKDLPGDPLGPGKVSRVKDVQPIAKASGIVDMGISLVLRAKDDARFP